MMYDDAPVLSLIITMLMMMMMTLMTLMTLMIMRTMFTRMKFLMMICTAYAPVYCDLSHHSTDDGAAIVMRWS